MTPVSHGNPEFPGDNGPMDQPSAALFDNSGCDGNNKGHGGVDGIAGQDSTGFEARQIVVAAVVAVTVSA